MSSPYLLHQGITLLLSYLCNALYKKPIIPECFLKKSRIGKDEFIYIPLRLLCVLHAGIIAFQTVAVFQPYYLHQKTYPLKKARHLFYDISLFFLKKATYIIPSDINLSLSPQYTPNMSYHIVYDPIYIPYMPLKTLSIKDFLSNPTEKPPLLLGKISCFYMKALKELYPNDRLKIITPVFSGKTPQELWQTSLSKIADTMLAGIWSLQLPFLIEAFSKGLCPISFYYHILTHSNPHYVIQVASVLLSLPIQHPSELKDYDLEYIKPTTSVICNISEDNTPSYDILSFLLQQE